MNTRRSFLSLLGLGFARGHVLEVQMGHEVRQAWRPGVRALGPLVPGTVSLLLPEGRLADDGNGHLVRPAPQDRPPYYHAGEGDRVCGRVNYTTGEISVDLDVDATLCYHAAS